MLKLRRAYPKVTAKLVELSPADQIAGLRRGDLDVALVGNEGRVLTKDFYTQNLASYPAVAVLPRDHRLANRRSISLRELKGEVFLSCLESDMPGRDKWVEAQCRREGFRPRFGPVSKSMADAVSLMVSTSAVALVPAYMLALHLPGLRVMNLKDTKPSWDLIVVWHRGRASAPLKGFLEALQVAARECGEKKGQAVNVIILAEHT